MSATSKMAYNQVTGSGNSMPRRSPSPDPSHEFVKNGATTAKKRIRHACDRCRLIRSRCSGGAQCERCIKDSVECVYGDHKRERNRKELAQSYSRIRELERENKFVVATLGQIVDAAEFDSVKYPDAVDLLARYRGDAVSSSRSHSDSHSPSNSKTLQSRGQAEYKTASEGSLSSTVGSPGQQGELHKAINLDHGAGAVGLIGKMSSMSWIQRCFDYSGQPIDNLTVGGLGTSESGTHTNFNDSLNYFADDQNLLAVDEDDVYPFQWPPSDTAVVLTEAFFRGTQGVFAFLSLRDFLEAVDAGPPDPATISPAQCRSLALTNLIWAIGSKWLPLVQSDSPGMKDDHLVYYARARALGLDHRMCYDHPNEEIVGEMSVLTFYLLINGSITRAWNTIGNAIRQAMTLGLHLKVLDPSIGEYQRRKRAQTWFSMYKLQMLIAEITGRHQLIRAAHVTIPLEVLEEQLHDYVQADGIDSSKSDLSVEASETWLKYLASIDNVPAIASRAASDRPDLRAFTASMHQDLLPHSIRLCQLSADIADQLYTGLQNTLWVHTQDKIRSLQHELDAWKTTLPKGVILDKAWSNRDQPLESIQLTIYSYSVAMTIHRLCLCEINIPNEAESSRLFNIASAQACVNAAISLIRFLPDQFAAQTVYRLLPWWALLHYICQAAAVLLLELYLDSQHFQGETQPLFRELDKAMAYLTHMAENSLSAYKARRIFDELIKRLRARRE